MARQKAEALRLLERGVHDGAEVIPTSSFHLHMVPRSSPNPLKAKHFSWREKGTAFSARSQMTCAINDGGAAMGVLGKSCLGESGLGNETCPVSWVFL